jgi:hypothetical protein
MWECKQSFTSTLDGVRSKSLQRYFGPGGRKTELHNWHITSHRILYTREYVLVFIVLFHARSISRESAMISAKLYATLITVHSIVICEYSRHIKTYAISCDFLAFKPLKSENHLIILWHVVPLLGNDSETSKYTTAVTRQRPANSNRGTVSSVQSVPRCYKQDKLGVAVR